MCTVVGPLGFEYPPKHSLSTGKMEEPFINRRKAELQEYFDGMARQNVALKHNAFLEFFGIKKAILDIVPQWPPTQFDRGILYFKLIEARHILITDPYTKITITENPQRKGDYTTNVINKSNNPIWNYECTYQFRQGLKEAVLELNLLDKILIGRDKKSGTVVYPLNRVGDNVVIFEKQPLQFTKSGDLTFAMYFSPSPDNITEIFQKEFDADKALWDAKLSLFLTRLSIPPVPWKLFNNFPQSLNPTSPKSIVAAGESKASAHTLITMLPQYLSRSVSHLKRVKSDLLKISTRGDDGFDGSHGHCGYNGMSGGGYGSNGSNGGPGAPGQSGTRGADGRSVVLTMKLIEEDPNGGLVVALSDREPISFPAPITEDTGIAIDTCGGKGGNGGRGGDGGDGGCGGDGYPGTNGHTAGIDGTNGTNGGPGGNGGNGGDGGNGGHGQDGGHAGNVEVSVSDPRLLVLLAERVRARGGAAGTGGSGGSGGCGGHGGSGGRGGWGGSAGSRQVPYQESYTVYENGQSTTKWRTAYRTEYGRRGMDGFSGSSGSSGYSGCRGANGQHGIKGNDGIIKFNVVDAMTGVMKESSSEIYRISFVSFTLSDGVEELQDGIFEPGQQILISNIVVRNDGGLTIPFGVKLVLVPAYGIVPLDGEFIELPPLAPGMEALLEGKFIRGFIHQFSPPKKPGALSHIACLAMQAETLNRSVPYSNNVSDLTVRYPISVVSGLTIKSLGHNESGVISVTITNNSTIPYGVDSRTAVTVVFRHDSSLSSNATPCTPDGRIVELVVPIENLLPGEHRSLTMPVTMMPFVTFFDRIKWRAEIQLRGNPIEYYENDIRCSCDWSQFHNPQAFASTKHLVVFAGHNFTMENFMGWSFVAAMLRLHLYVWDYDRYNGLSKNITTNVEHPLYPNSWRPNPDITSKQSFKVFCLDPDNEPEMVKAWWGLNCNDLINHFPYKKNSEFPPLFESLALSDLADNGLLFYGLDPIILRTGLGSVGKPVNYCKNKDLIFGTDKNDPKESDAMEKVKKIIEQVNKDDPLNAYEIGSMQLQIQKNDPKSDKKWSYGDLIINQVNIPVMARMCCWKPINQIHGDAKRLTSLEAEIDSPLFNILFHLSFAMSIKTKFELLALSSRNLLLEPILIINPKLQMSFLEVLSIGLYTDLLCDPSGSTKEYKRLNELHAVINSNVDLYFDKGAAVACFYAMQRYGLWIKQNSSFFSSMENFNKIRDSMNELGKKLFMNSFSDLQNEVANLVKKHTSTDIAETKECAQIVTSLVKSCVDSWWSRKVETK
eukprot:TRINITY_DN5167_c0_g1_i2.p1 TRINITY_DN5167_c0_g1~~TRINITY_DN5167_c0_g1_i2.p1  ORF type:complete len:1347 (+),score=382.77 TRINITY_DN5167_c0_g1_i2:178-4041(+)